MNRGEFEASPVQAQPEVAQKKKNSPVLMAMTIVFALTTIGLGVWVAILLVNKPKEEAKISNNEVSQQASESGDSGEVTAPGGEVIEDARIGYVLNDHCTTGFLTKGGEFYVKEEQTCDYYYGNKSIGIGSADAATGKNGSFTVSYGSGKDITEYVILSDGESGSPDTVSFKGLKVNDSGIVAAARAEFGQNGYSGYVLVKEDGTVDFLSLDLQENNKFLPKLTKNFGGFKNIASAVVVDNGDSMSTVLITRNGGQISATQAFNNLLGL